MKEYIGKVVILHDGYKGIVEGITDDNYILTRTIKNGKYRRCFTIDDVIRNNGNIDNWKNRNYIKYLSSLRYGCTYRWVSKIDDRVMAVINSSIMETE